MPDTFHCARGHRWRPTGGDTPGPAAGATCPECGAAGEPVPEIDADECFPADDLPPPPGNNTTPAGRGWPFVPSRLPPVVDGYEIGEEIGRGGMAVVYRARQRSLDRSVALKVLLPSARTGPEEETRVRAEAEAVARLQHPNVVHVYEVGERDGCPYLLMEYVDGGTLADRLRGGPPPPAKAAEWAEAIARGIHAAHRRGIVHRDLKPANVLMTGDGVPKISDFGIARRLDGTGEATRTGVVMGTPAYMAPEQAEGRGKSAGPPADVWAVGAILYEMLTGRPPFTGESALDTLRKVTTDPPVPPSRLQPDVPPALEAVCLRCLHKRPGDRYPTAEALADDLARCRAGLATIGTPARPSGRWRLPIAVGVGLVLVVALVVWLGGRSGEQTPAEPPSGPPTADSSATQPPTTPNGGPVAPTPPVVAPPPIGEPEWKQFRVAPAAEDELFQRIAFPTRDTGLVASNHAVYRTDDGGQTWNPTWRGKPDSVHFLTFENTDRGWLGAGQLYHTADGGKTWNPVPLPGITAVRALALGPGGWGLAGGSTAAGELVLFRRKPGAQEWEKLDPAATRLWGGEKDKQPYRDWSLGGLAVAGPMDAWLTLSAAGSEAGVVLRTPNAGDTWEPVFPAATYLRDIHFADPDRGWLAGFRGKLWTTTDGGREWVPQPNPGGDVTVSGLAFARSGEPVALAPLSEGRVLRTDDGRTWRAADTGLDFYSAPAAAVVDPGRAYVLGSDGRVARYTDPRVPPRP